MKKILSRLILNYFRFFARLKLKKNPESTIIGITGSVGKTTTRLALVQILATHGVVKHSIHANSESGISLSILGLSPTTYSLLDWLRLVLLAPYQLVFHQEKYKYYVVEMGIDSPVSPKNMTYLLSIIQPHIGIVLNANLVHSENFDHLVKDMSPSRRPEKIISLIAKEKMQLAKGMRSSGVAIINMDQKEFARSRRDLKTRVISFGKSEKADLIILPRLRFKYQGITYKLNIKGIFPESYAYNFAAAIACAAALGIPPSLSVSALSSFGSPAGRLRIFPGIRESTIIDSTYNASPTSVLESLRLLQAKSGQHKKIAVIGDMRELGISKKSAHKDLADWLVKYADEAILFGELTGTYTYPVLKAKKFPVHHFLQMRDLVAYLTTCIKPKSWVLVKGSQNTIYLERAVAALLANQDDVPKLCRRGKYWDQLRAKTP